MENVGGEGSWSHAHSLSLINSLAPPSWHTCRAWIISCVLKAPHWTLVQFASYKPTVSLSHVPNTFQSPAISHSRLSLISSLTMEFSGWCLARESSCSSASSFHLLVPVHAWLASLLFQHYSTFPKMPSSYLLLWEAKTHISLKKCQLRRPYLHCGGFDVL